MAMVHTFTIPEKVLKRCPPWEPPAQEVRNKWPTAPKKIGIRLLSIADEIDAAKVGGTSYIKIRYESIQRAIVELDGKPVSYADGEAVTYWGHCGPVVRALLLSVYDRLHGASDEEERDFLKSEEVKATG